MANPEVKEYNNDTWDELLALKRQLAKEIAQKMEWDDSHFLSKKIKKSIENYLTNENTIVDNIFDKTIEKIWKGIWIITPELESYREMINNAKTKDELDNLKNTILNNISEKSQNPTNNQPQRNPQEQPSTAPESRERIGKTYTNPKSWLTYNLYDQALWSRWKLKYKWWNTTVADIGCMITSAACVTSAIDPLKTPKDFFESYPHTHVFKSIPKITNRWKAKQITQGDKQQQIEDNLKKGYPAIFMVRWKKRWWSNKYTTSQHYMAAVDIRENNGQKEIFIANTHNNRWGGRVPANEIFISMQEASIYTPSQA